MRNRLYPAADSNALTYLLDAVGVEDYDPALDTSGLADERLAMVWCLFYGDCWPWIGPTVQAEYKKIKAVDKRETHNRWTRFHLQNQPLPTPENELQKRAEELLPHHNKMNDCRVVAEAEFKGAQVLLSVDVDLRRLQPYTPVKILRPTEFWASLQITQEPRVANMPALDNPLRNKAWWHFPKGSGPGTSLKATE